ncbi:MAG: hypothetical protein IPM02_25700 [Betaproteobacteria bacterium]|nr:hypothetical protein [Betaproteobacteria bacterium]
MAKINDAVIALWSRVLARVPGSRLLLKSRPFIDASFRQRISERFARHAVPAGRLLLEADEPREAYLAAHRRVDIALDPSRSRAARRPLKRSGWACLC